MEFLGFLQWDYCKEILENNDLKIHIETGNISCKVMILTNRCFNL